MLAIAGSCAYTYIASLNHCIESDLAIIVFGAGAWRLSTLHKATQMRQADPGLTLKTL